MLKSDDFCKQLTFENVNGHWEGFAQIVKSPFALQVEIFGWDLFGFLSFDLCFFGASLFFLIPEGFASFLTENPALHVIFFGKIQGKHAGFLQCLPSFLPRVPGISMDSTSANLRNPASGRGAAFIQYTMFITIMAAAPCHLKG